MSAQASADDRARHEAADWFARLSSRTVSTDTLRAFRLWRETAENAQAYGELEALWKAAKRLDADREIQAAVQSALNPKRRSWRDGFTSSHLKLLAFGAAALGAALLTTRVIMDQGGHAYRSGIGEQRIVRLEDGSRMRLDTDTRLTVRFVKDARHIELSHGQAFFEVAHDPSRPFTVRANGTEVRAIGTRFDVRRDGARVAVTLLDGRVQVRGPQGGVWMLEPGQQLRLDALPPDTPGEAPRVDRIDVAAATSWTSGRLTFYETPLTTAIAEVNRYGRHRLALDAPDLAAREVSGVFDTGDTQAFATAVADLYGLKLGTGADGGLVLRRPPPPAG